MNFYKSSIYGCALFFLLGSTNFVNAQTQPNSFPVGKQHLQGHVPKAVLTAPIIGELPESTVLNLAIGLPLRNQEELRNQIREIYNPTSPKYRHFLTSQQFTDMFGPTTDDYRKLADFIKTMGISITGTFPNRSILDISGPVKKISEVFHVKIHTYRRSDGSNFFAPENEPSVDLDLPIQHISGLDNYGVTKRAWGTGTSASCNGGYTGNDFKNVYLPGLTLDGTGQTIGLVQFDDFYDQDITNYKSKTGITTLFAPERVFQNGPLPLFPGGKNNEVAMDIEMIMSMAPKSLILVYENETYLRTESDWVNVLQKIANDDLAKVISCSWFNTVGPDSNLPSIFYQFAIQGQTFLQASGDTGAYVTGAPETTPPVPINSSDLMTVVGGTSLQTTGTQGGGNAGNYFSESTWNDPSGASGGGICQSLSIPFWQQTTDMSSNGGSVSFRNFPDVSMLAQYIEVCANNGATICVGGTSAAAPLWAGFITLVNQEIQLSGGSGYLNTGYAGFINPAIYSIASNNSAYASDFNDITSGSNNGYSAIKGFDLATGLGSPKTNLIYDLAGVTLSPTSTKTPTPTISATPTRSFTPNSTKTIASLSISGPSSVNENSNAVYTATAHFSDGSSSTVPASWSVSGSVATINSSTGQLVTGSVSINTAVTISASYTYNSTQVTGTYNITVLYEPPPTTTPALSAPTLNSPGNSSNPGPRMAAGSTNLSWNSVSGAQTYTIYFWSSSTGAVTYTGWTTTTFTVGVSAGGSYSWQVQAVNSSGSSPLSSEFYFQGPLPVPTLIAPGTSTSPGPQVTGSSVQLNWNPVPGAGDYGVDVWDATTSSLSPYYLGNVNSMTFSSLTPGHNYYWEVQSETTYGGSSSGNSDWSSPYYFTVSLPTATPTITPTVPFTPTPTFASISPTSTPSQNPSVTTTPNQSLCSPSLSNPVTIATDNVQMPRIKKWGNNVYVASVDGSKNLVFYKSTDSGASFAGVTLGNPVMNSNPNDVEFSMDANGYLYAFWENENNDQLYFRKSLDGGTNWNAATTFISGFSWTDEPSAYFSNGTLYLAFRGFKSATNELYLTKSTDTGNSFSIPVQVANSTTQFDTPEVAVFGSNVYIAYMDLHSVTPNNTYLSTSTDGGNSFNTAVRVNGTIGKSVGGCSLGVDSSGNVFVAYTDTTIHNSGDINVAKSTNGGNTFNYTVASDSTAFARSYPVIFIDTNTYIHVLWRDERSGVNFSDYYTRSVDDGTSYAPNIDIGSPGNINDGCLYADSGTVLITETNYTPSPWTTLLYKLNWVCGTPTLTATQTPPPTSTPTITLTPTITNTPTITYTPTNTPTFDKSLNGLVLAPNIARDGTPVRLFFDKLPQSSSWKVYTMAGELVRQLQFSSVANNTLDTNRMASGLYLVRIEVVYADGSTNTQTFKVVVIH